MKITETFLREHRIRPSDVNIGDLVAVFTRDMEDGLAGRRDSLSMIPTYIEAENEFLKNTPVLAIDAGGTNFRAARIRFDKSGKIETGEISRHPMPGLDREISSNEFFRIISDYIRPVVHNSDRIGFCFSYPTEILPSGDGRLIQFCKEVQAPEVEGQLIGKNLLEALGTPDKHIVLLNDTVATLLAGKSASQKNYDSFIGFILGTGTNTCYIEQNSKILKNKQLDQNKSQIINVESGNFNKGPRTDLDILFDNTTMNPGNYTFEKMFSGGYFGGLCLFIIKQAAREGVFSEEASSRILSLEDLTSNDANEFSCNPSSESNVLRQCFTDINDVINCLYIIDTLIERAAKLVAANLAAVVLKTEKGHHQSRPVLITVEGTTYSKLHNLKNLSEYYLAGFLTGERKRYLEFTRVEKSGLIGAALAALIN